VVGVGIGKHPLWHVSKDFLLSGQLGDTELGSSRVRSQGDHRPNLLLVNLPKLDGLVCKRRKEEPKERKWSATKEGRRGGAGEEQGEPLEERRK